VVAFGSATDVEHNIVFENFVFASTSSNGNAALAPRTSG
jgi:hypothetical protein